MMENTRVVMHSVRAECEVTFSNRFDVIVAQGFYDRDRNNQGNRPVVGSCLLWLRSTGKDVVRQGNQFLQDGKPITLTLENHAMLIAYCDLFSEGALRNNALLRRVRAWLALTVAPNHSINQRLHMSGSPEPWRSTKTM